jgi:hypothetical protein
MHKLFYIVHKPTGYGLVGTCNSRFRPIPYVWRNRAKYPHLETFVKSPDDLELMEVSEPFTMHPEDAEIRWLLGNTHLNTTLNDGPPRRYTFEDYKAYLERHFEEETNPVDKARWRLVIERVSADPEIRKKFAPSA